MSHVVSYDLLIVHEFDPVYNVLGRRVFEDPRAEIEIHVKFDSSKAAQEFQAKVQEIIDEALSGVGTEPTRR